jgi:hypothetical protein
MMRDPLPPELDLEAELADRPETLTTPEADGQAEPAVLLLEAPASGGDESRRPDHQNQAGGSPGNAH